MFVLCSAGVGRTGTFIAIDILMQRMAEHHNINVQELILQMRAQRVSMVQTVVCEYTSYKGHSILSALVLVKY